MREYLLDVSRLIWRSWRGGLPTGIDRVCLAYVERFADRSQAVVQRSGFRFILSPKDSDRLFDFLLKPGPAKRRGLVRMAAMTGPAALRSVPRPGTIYLNVGHTGLNEPSLPVWIKRNKLRAVYLIHDLIPITHPEFCRPGEAEKHRRRMVNVLDSASALIGNSQATLDDLAAFAASRGSNMPPSIAAPLSGLSLLECLQPKTLDRPHFVVLGTIEGRKNHALVLDLWRKLVADLGDKAPVLLIVGQRGWQAGSVFEQLDNLGELEGHVRELGRCGDEELGAWIRGARAVLMPSFVEGFGLPVIESLRLGVPVIASDLRVYREIAGDIPTYLDPLDQAGWERMIRAFTDGGEERDRQLERIKGYHPPDWDCHFSAVESWLDAFESAGRAQEPDRPILQLNPNGRAPSAFHAR